MTAILYVVGADRCAADGGLYFKLYLIRALMTRLKLQRRPLLARLWRWFMF